MPTPTSSQPRLTVAQRAALMGGGVLVAVLVTLLLLRVVDRRSEVIFTAGMGDLFFHRPAAVAPPPNPNEILSRHRIAWDVDGFRLPARPAARYDVVALGDSYTEGTNVARPWSDVLAEQSGLAVYNMGFRGFGPAEESRVLKDYGLKHAPRYVIVGFFEGNDLYDAVSARWRGEFIPPNVQREQLNTLGTNYTPPTPHPPPYQFPVRIAIKGITHDIAFLDGYLGWVNGDYATYAESVNLREVDRYWGEMQTALGETLPETCLFIAYFPAAPHIYAPYVVPEDRTQMLSTVEEMSLPKAGALIEGTVIPSAFEDVLPRLGNQRDALRALAEKRGIAFIDLVPVFEAAAARGEVLYYTYDTHWNQAGHDLAGATIAAYLKDHGDACRTP